MSKNDFKFIMASDPQYPWTGQDDETGEYLYEDDPNLYAQMQIDSMKKLLSDEGDQIKGIMFNGDIVKFNNYVVGKAKTEDLDNFEKKYYNVLKQEVPVYIGLGNHDYENNVHDSFEERAATELVSFLHDSLFKYDDRVTKSITGVHFLHIPDHDGVDNTRFFGSFSYSFEIGDIHFIQVNNYPFYEKSWDAFNSAKARHYYCSVRKSLAWLERDMAIARNNGKAIILCMHKNPAAWELDEKAISDFGNLLNEYSVSAIFVGHIHWRVGQVNNENLNGIPVFYCGGTSQGSYLLLSFAEVTEDNDKKIKMTVKSISSEDGDVTYENNWDIALNNSSESVQVPEGEKAIVFHNKGVYSAEFTVKYKDKAGNEHSASTGRKPVSSKHTIILDRDCEVISIKGKAIAGETIFSGKTDVNCTYVVSGTTLITKYHIDKDLDWY